MDLRWPESRADVARIQSERKRLAFERAKGSAFYKGRLDHIDVNRLDDPEVWASIPLLTKEDLRKVSAKDFYDQFCVAPREAVVEYWRSGGSTGRPLFYPRSAEDMDWSILPFRRGLFVTGATARDLVHVSFPLGIHPVAHLYARAAEGMGIGTVWCGAGTNTPSELQLQLIDELQPTIWTGMASYGLHLGNLAEIKGFDLANSSVTKIIVAAEPLSPAKRQKLERMWGAQVFDQFGMTEGALMSCEGSAGVGAHLWTDLYFCEVVDEESGAPVGDGEVGTFVMTPLWNNNVTPFLRWNSGDLVSIVREGGGAGPLSFFPILRHERRTVGFFKVRGVNINHPELEDLMFYDPEVTEFRAEVYNDDRGLDVLHLVLELKRDAAIEAAHARIVAKVRATFEVTPRLTVQPPGTIAREFEANIKAPRFVDKRG
jgi:phenylacetate-CoA ligase